ncbi:MAG: YmdB family metallophosphoesterase [Treponema sp.]|jgi:metallophosphoesterase (TIGR00282 family)|nr:YmdB family metallophosphoesterase [Treponema sp.]
MAIFKAIMIGDVVGDPGLLALETQLPGLIKEHSADFVVVNGENAAEGFGLTEACLKRILAAGADVVTGGNHIWEKRDFWPVLDSEPRVLRPGNYPAGTPGRGWAVFEKPQTESGAPVSWCVVNLQGRKFMTAIDCPFRYFDSLREALEGAGQNAMPQSAPPRPVILVDFHAEATEEKEALGYYLDGRASVIAGTHTHVQTADERILPKGTAYITDLGMTGVTDSVIGMDRKVCLDRVRKQVLFRMECAQPGPDGQGSVVQGIAAEIDGDTGKALSIMRLG